jgi:hypothetical protein
MTLRNSGSPRELAAAVVKDSELAVAQANRLGAVGGSSVGGFGVRNAVHGLEGAAELAVLHQRPGVDF